MGSRCQSASLWEIQYQPSQHYVKWQNKFSSFNWALQNCRIFLDFNRHTVCALCVRRWRINISEEFEPTNPSSLYLASLYCFLSKPNINILLQKYHICLQTYTKKLDIICHSGNLSNSLCNWPVSISIDSIPRHILYNLLLCPLQFDSR